MKTVTVDTYNRVITRGIVDDDSITTTMEELINKFQQTGFEVFFCYDGRTTLIRKKDDSMGSITVTDSTPGDILLHGRFPGVPLTCLGYVFP